jgi:hypothetical protein
VHLVHVIEDQRLSPRQTQSARLMQKCVTRYELQDFVVMSLVDCSEPTIAGEHLVVARWCVMAKEGIAEEGIVFAQRRQQRARNSPCDRAAASVLQRFVSSLRRSADSRNDKSRIRHKSLGPDLGRSVFRIRGFSIPTPPPFNGSARSRVPKSAVDFIEFDGRDYGFASNIEQLKDTFTMSRAQPKSSPTDQHARRIAAALAKGQPPVRTPDLDLYLESSPHEIFVAFEGAARHMPPAGKDEMLAFGYLFLLQGLLEHLRYRTDRGYADAAGLIAEFQAEVAARVETGRLDRHMLAFVGRALHQSKIPTSPELAAASAKLHVDDGEDASPPADIRAALAGLLETCGGDPFARVGSRCHGC